MSGKKTGIVTHLPEQLEALHEALMRRLFLIDEKQVANQETENRFVSMVSQTQDQLKAREAEFQAYTRQLNGQLADMEIQTSQELINNQALIEERLVKESAEIQGNIVNYLDDQLTQFNQEVTRHHQQQHTQIQRLRREIHLQNRSANEKALIVENWLKDAHSLIQFIDNHYDHPKFAPTRLSDLDEDLQLAIQNYDGGLYEAALVTGQNVYRRASELRISLERDENQWNTCFLMASKKIDQILTELEEKQVIPYQPEGTEQVFDFDINFWSDKGWEKMRNKTGRYQRQLGDASHNLSIEDLRKWLIEDLPALEADIQTVKNKAVTNLVNSQIRTNIADLIMQALQKQGYQLDNSLLDCDDSRDGFGFTARSNSGNAIHVLVNPGPNDKNEIQLESIDQRPQTEHFHQRRAYEISQALQKFGLKVDEFRKTSQPEVQSRIEAPILPAQVKNQYVQN